MSGEYKICKRCIMDTTDPEIEFDGQGRCNHCGTYDERVQNELHYDQAGREKLEQMINKIKKEGKDKENDCIIGLSGGTDSSMVAYRVKELGLRQCVTRCVRQILCAELYRDSRAGLH